MKENKYFKWNGVLYELYWDTAMDRKTWCRVKVLGQDGRKYQYPYYFRTKRAAQVHIISSNPIKKAA